MGVRFESESLSDLNRNGCPICPGIRKDERHISSVDADGVALAAIQGLNEKVESGKRKTETRMEQLEKENVELKARLGVLEQLLKAQIQK